MYAGILIYSDFQSVSAEDMLDCFRVNTLGPLLTSQALLNAGLLGGSRPSVIGNVTSKASFCWVGTDDLCNRVAGMGAKGQQPQHHRQHDS